MSPARPIRSSQAALVVSLMALIACASETGGANGGLADFGGSLGEPSAVFAEDFGSIQTVREVAGGVLVADPLGGALYFVDMDAGTRTVVGTEGQGPGEYLQPDAVWPLPGDSTLLVDLGNGRMITLGPDLEFGPTSPLSAGSPRSGGMVVAIPQAVDGSGNVYARSIGGMRAQLQDSGSVLRIQRGGLTFETVATFKLEDRTRTTSGSAGNENVSIELVPLSPEDSWGVASDGSVVVARSRDFHIEWFSPDGTVTRGTAVPFDPIAIGTAEKEEWSRARGQSGGGIGIRIEVNNGAMETSFSRGNMGDGGDENLDQYDWPETKPPFYSGRLVVDPQDRVWVRRHVEAGDDTTYDVFNRASELVATYALPNNKVVVGFGTGSVYVVAFDEFDLNYLERFDMPAM